MKPSPPSVGLAYASPRNRAKWLAKHHSSLNQRALAAQQAADDAWYRRVMGTHNPKAVTPGDDRVPTSPMQRHTRPVTKGRNQ